MLSFIEEDDEVEKYLDCDDERDDREDARSPVLGRRSLAVRNYY